MSEELKRAVSWLERQAEVYRKFIEVTAEMGIEDTDINHPAVLLEHIAALKEATEVLSKLATEFSGTPPGAVDQVGGGGVCAAGAAGVGE